MFAALEAVWKLEESCNWLLWSQGSPCPGLCWRRSRLRTCRGPPALQLGGVELRLRPPGKLGGGEHVAAGGPVHQVCQYKEDLLHKTAKLKNNFLQRSREGRRWSCPACWRARWWPPAPSPSRPAASSPRGLAGSRQSPVEFR